MWDSPELNEQSQNIDMANADLVKNPGSMESPDNKSNLMEAIGRLMKLRMGMVNPSDMTQDEKTQMEKDKQLTQAWSNQQAQERANSQKAASEIGRGFNPIHSNPKHVPLYYPQFR